MRSEHSLHKWWIKKDTYILCKKEWGVLGVAVHGRGRGIRIEHGLQKSQILKFPRGHPLQVQFSWTSLREISREVLLMRRRTACSQPPEYINPRLALISVSEALKHTLFPSELLHKEQNHRQLVLGQGTVAIGCFLKGVVLICVHTGRTAWRFFYQFDSGNGFSPCLWRRQHHSSMSFCEYKT